MIKVGFVINFDPKKWLGGYNFIINLIKLYENIDVKINKIKERPNPGQLGLTPGTFMEGY